MRSLLVDIYPPSLRAGGLPAALNDLATTASGSDARIEVDVDPEAAAALDADAQRAAFRVAQESLRNALKHARASVIRLELTRVGSAVRLDVSDDGAGFDPEVAKNAATEGHLGLQLMADVTTAVGGTLAVCNESGARLANGDSRPMTTVLLADDHRLVRAGLVRLLATADGYRRRRRGVGRAAGGRAGESPFP